MLPVLQITKPLMKMAFLVWMLLVQFPMPIFGLDSGRYHRPDADKEQSWVSSASQPRRIASAAKNQTEPEIISDQWIVWFRPMNSTSETSTEFGADVNMAEDGDDAFDNSTLPPQWWPNRTYHNWTAWVMNKILDQWGLKQAPTHIYQYGWIGLALNLSHGTNSTDPSNSSSTSPLPASEILARIRQDPDVLALEQDTMVFKAGSAKGVASIQMNPPNWGLDRIDQRSSRLDGLYRYNYTGAGVKVFIMDTGLYQFNLDFSFLRTACGFNAFKGELLCPDGDGHGTHIAGIIGGNTYGVAKKAGLVSVKVLDRNGQGTLSNVLAGIDYITQQKLSKPDQPMVATLALQQSTSRMLNQAINAASSLGVVMVAAAGNRGINACANSPASARQAITVGASTHRDLRASFSNWGLCVDLYAPGASIISASNSGPFRFDSLSGTSQAAAHVAGVAALYLERNPTWTPAMVKRRMKRDATLLLTTVLPTFANRLLCTTRLY